MGMNAHSVRAKRPLLRLRLVSLVTILALPFSIMPPLVVRAHLYPPYWDGGNGDAVHYAPVAWPDESDWIAYTRNGSSINDPRTLDPSHGGARPQNHVNVSSGCPDQSLPSVYYAYDSANPVIFYRWRVEQIGNTYGTGPNAGSYSNSDPWNSALWTVLIDIDGDGFREFAVHLDGSSGTPGEAIDLLAGIYSDTPGQSIDYE